PSNIFLQGGDAGQAKLLDFGIARRVANPRPLTQTGMVIGTPEYMAPEQARGVKQLTAAADVFSLGCVLYEWLAGEPPFVAEHIAAVLVRILFEEPVPVEELRPGLPEALCSLVRAMLAKEPAARPVDAAALVAALDAIGEADEVPIGRTAPQAV